LYFNNIESKKLILERNIINSYGNVVDQKKRKIISTQNDLVEADVINLTKFSTGGYLLILTLADSTANTFSKSSKKFYLYNPTESDNIHIKGDPGFLPSEFIYLSEEECDFEFSSLRYFLNNNKKKTYNSLQKVEAKRKFLYNYWNNSDFDLTLPASQKRIKFSERVDYVNKKFGTFNKDGISTDRGMVYLKYGAPDDIENHHNDPGAKPYEIWEYNSLEGGVIFIFGDVFGYNDYELIHSTKRGEIYDPQWQKRIFKAY
ncbi:MAG TPA: GWxTD domain-containing protein, partial [Ignavibacteria bacterium]|nr:GWxTD domain-containing protein [Ignavibacteria bacterium]